ncbi:hypothetical protein ABD72_10175 [Brevibacillus laterosporus]|nr:hypothetical protein BrL25_12775 [Brevibacillus laterosporus DSM 25]MBG9802513.1 hypothetical protein [Brevibacillus laterosporus]TPH17981.1 hypothetical protein EGH09_08530 [Brevibacillus laterosporus]
MRNKSLLITFALVALAELIWLFYIKQNKSITWTVGIHILIIVLSLDFLINRKKDHYKNYRYRSFLQGIIMVGLIAIPLFYLNYM